MSTSSLNNSSFSFWDHLEELRSRIIKSCLALIGGCVAFLPFAQGMLDFLLQPVDHLIFTAPSEAFVLYCGVVLAGGTIIAMPVIIYQGWMFVVSAMTEKEKKYVFLFAPVSFFLFMVGVLFAYGVMIPISLKLFLSFSSPRLIPMITLNNYFSYLLSMCLSFGIIFEMPLVMIFLTHLGITTPQFLIQKRRQAIVIILILSAILTPPDHVSLLLMAVPLIVLYELSIRVCILCERYSKAHSPEGSSVRSARFSG